MYTISRCIHRTRPFTLALRTSSANCATRMNPLTRTLITKYYTEEHESIVFDDKTGIGILTITDHAQSNLGDVVFVELPAVGRQVAKGESVGAVESVKAASDIYAPASGTVEEVNEALSEQPHLLNKSPEEDGWLCKIKLSDPSELEKLLTREAYNQFIE